MALFNPDDLRDEGPETMPAVVQRARQVLSPVATADQLRGLVALSTHITQITNAAGRDQAHSARMALTRTRIAITKTGKAAREDAQAFTKAVIAAERDLIGITTPEEGRLESLVAAWDERKAAEKRAATEAEERRVQALRVRAAAGQIAMRRADPTADDLRAEIARIDALVIDDTLQEFADEARETRAASLSELTQWLARVTEAEARRAQEAEERRQAEARLQAERAEIAREKAAQEAERKRIEAERQKVEREQAELREQKAQHDREVAEAEARRERQRAEELAREEARKARERAEAEARQQAEAREAAAREKAAREAEERRTRAKPSREQIVGVIAEAFATDADIALGWLTAEFAKPEVGDDSF